MRSAQGTASEPSNSDDSIRLRQWRAEDLEAFAEMNADPEAMEFFPRKLTKAESRETLRRLRTGIDRRGWGLWAVDVNGALAGFTGLSAPKFTAHFTPCVEIGWRLRREYWGRGIAYAAALRAQSYGFEKLKLPELVSFTTVANSRSRRLMVRLGFTWNPADDFLHPQLPPDSPLRPHVLYRKRNPTPDLSSVK